MSVRVNKVASHFSEPRRLIRFISDDNKTYFGLLLKTTETCDIGNFVNVFPDNVNIYNKPSLSQQNLTNQKKKIVKLLSPIQVSNIWCVGLNYKLHAKESNMAIPKNPVMFMKPTTTVTHPNSPILIPKCCDLKEGEVDYEVELAIVIGKECKNTSVEKALEYVLGYTVANDVSARKWQLAKELGGGQWIRGKSFDTFCPVGPCIVMNDGGWVNANNLAVWTKLNGKMMQHSNTNDMIFNVQEIVAFLSKGTTLLPGTVILTGTPSGIGMAQKPKAVYLKEGDKVTVGVDLIGELTNTVQNE